MSKELYIAATPHETKVAIVEEEQLTEVYYERENEYTLAGSVYKGRVTRVLPGMQSAFVDVGLERDAFLYVTDFMEESEDGDEYVVTQAPAIAHEGEERHTARRDHHEPEEASEDAAEEGDDNTAVAAEGESTGSTQQRGEDRGGVRRWRGRRGRRRGRGDFRERRPEAAASTEALDSTGVPPPPPPPVEELVQEEHPHQHQHHQEHQETRHARHEEPRRHSRRPEPSVDEAPAAADAFVLPGESISKYRPAGEAQQESSHRPEQAARPVSSFRPSTEVTELPVTGWAGGNILPGESLSKYRGSHSAAIGEPVALVSAQLEGAHAESVDAVAAVHAYAHPEPAELPAAPVVITSPEIVEPAVATEETKPAVQPYAAEAAERSWATKQHEDNEAAYVPPVPAAAAEASEYAQEVRRSSEPARALEEAIEILHTDATPYEAPRLVSSEIVVEDAAAVVEAPAHGFAQHEGQIEEEEIDEEEYEFGHFIADDDADLEEMEEETLAANTGVEIGEAVRDAHLEERVRGYEDLTGDLEEVDGEEAEEHEGVEAQAGELSEDDPDYEGRAELRAPAETAAFQQKTERSPQDRGRFSRRRGGGDRGGNRRQRGGSGGGGGNFSRQQHRPLPTISELLKEGQEILVQIAKEPIAKKGARITSHIALPGRFLVFMPTVNHVGVSRKISSEEERQRLKRILLSEKGTVHGGFIVRTAAGGASEEDLRADIRFLINLWTEIKNRSDNSKSPALIYHDLNLVERILRDQVSTNFSTVWVDSEQEYERVLRFLNRFQPSLVRRVKLYTKDAPLFEQFGLQEEINKALKSKVWLKSGGYIVINQTEALVAIDVNTGKYVGKTTRLEDTIVKTNVDAIQEIVRQIRLRDLGGIIVIDFIDMDERKNRQRVMQALEEALKADRAPSKVLQFNDFGLVAITRKRVKQSLERTLSTQCNYCTGTGMVKSAVTVCNEIYTEMRKMSRQLEGHDVLLRVNPEILKALKSNNGRWLTELEELARRTIIVKSDPALHMEQFDIH